MPHITLHLAPENKNYAGGIVPITLDCNQISFLGGRNGIGIGSGECTIHLCDGNQLPVLETTTVVSNLAGREYEELT